MQKNSKTRRTVINLGPSEGRGQRGAGIACACIATRKHCIANHHKKIKCYFPSQWRKHVLHTYGKTRMHDGIRKNISKSDLDSSFFLPTSPKFYVRRFVAPSPLLSTLSACFCVLPSCLKINSSSRCAVHIQENRRLPRSAHSTATHHPIWICEKQQLNTIRICLNLKQWLKFVI